MQTIPLIPLQTIRSTRANYLTNVIPASLAPHIYVYATSPVRKGAIQRGYESFGENSYHRYQFSRADFGLGHLAAFFQNPLMSFDRDLTDALQHHFGYVLVNPYQLGYYTDCQYIWLDANVILNLLKPQGGRLLQKLLKNAKSANNIKYILPDFIVKEIIGVSKNNNLRKPSHRRNKERPRRGNNQDWSIATRYQGLAKHLNFN